MDDYDYENPYRGLHDSLVQYFHNIATIAKKKEFIEDKEGCTKYRASHSTVGYMECCVKLDEILERYSKDCKPKKKRFKRVPVDDDSDV